MRTTGSTENIDRWREFEFIAPGKVIQFAGGEQAGEGKLAYEENGLGGRYRLRRFHCSTPETDTTTHYLSSVGNGHRPHDQASVDELFDEIDTTVRKDIALVEAQQKERERAGEEVPVWCEQGVSGTCLTRVLDGTPDHRDSYLLDTRKEANDQILCCCSRAKSKMLGLDLQGTSAKTRRRARIGA